MSAKSKSAKSPKRGRAIEPVRAKPSAPLVPLAVIAVVIIAAIVIIPNLFRGTLTKIEGVESFTNLARDHVTGSVSYPQTPPVGGKHSSVWQNCGIYDQPVPLETAVHSLEHGAVWIAYKPNLDDKDVQTLRALVRGRAYTLLAPYQYGALDHPVVAVAWGLRLPLERADDPRLAQFVNAYANGLQAPEPGAACVGGTGRPVE